jgi:hypothetical protein
MNMQHPHIPSSSWRKGYVGFWPLFPYAVKGTELSEDLSAEICDANQEAKFPKQGAAEEPLTLFEGLQSRNFSMRPGT